MAWKDKVIEGNPHRPKYVPMRRNRILDADSYKASHPFQFPADLTYLRAHLLSRGGRYGSTVWAGGG